MLAKIYLAFKGSALKLTVCLPLELFDFLLVNLNNYE